MAPFDGVIGERQVQPGDYVNIGSNLINVVPLPNVYVIANYKETQLTRVKPGQPVDITVDSFPSETLHGRVERICAGERIAVRTAAARQCHRQFHQGGSADSGADPLDKDQPLLERLLPGMSVVTRIRTGARGRGNGGK